MEVTVTKNQDTRKRSKAAKIVLWSILGCLCVAILAIVVWVVIAACGGTGTGDGGMFGFKFKTLTGVTGFIAVVLVMAWLLTEPSFKKEEVVYVEVKPQYVKKSARPQPVKTQPGAGKAEEKTEA